MIVTEYYMTREDGTILERTCSDQNLMIRQDGTEAVYSEAIDPQGSGRTYTETDIVIEEEPETEDGEPPFFIAKED